MPSHIETWVFCLFLFWRPLPLCEPLLLLPLSPTTIINKLLKNLLFICYIFLSNINCNFKEITNKSYLMLLEQKYQQLFFVKFLSSFHNPLIWTFFWPSLFPENTIYRKIMINELSLPLESMQSIQKQLL